MKNTSKVSLTVYNVLGQKVKTLLNQTMTAGVHQVKWNGLDENSIDLASGVYIYELKSGDVRLVKKMMLLE